MLDTSGHATIVIGIWVNGVEFIGQTRVGSFYKILMAACWCGDPRIQHKNQLSRQTGSRNLIGPKTLPTIWHTYIKLVTKYQIPVINSCLQKCDEKCAYTNVCKMCIKINKSANRKQESDGSKNASHDMGTYMKLVTKYQISAINSCWEKCDEKYLGRTDRGKTVYPPLPSGSGGIIIQIFY
jgi:hypothetical protein